MLNSALFQLVLSWGIFSCLYTFNLFLFYASSEFLVGGIQLGLTFLTNATISTFKWRCLGTLDFRLGIIKFYVTIPLLGLTLLDCYLIFLYSSCYFCFPLFLSSFGLLKKWLYLLCQFNRDKILAYFSSMLSLIAYIFSLLQSTFKWYYIASYTV